jgi:hypothetical protein
MRISESNSPPPDHEPEQRPTPKTTIFAAILATLASALALTAFAYYTVFSTLQCYDDEGYALIQIHHFFMGWRLYDDIITLYGPMFFLVARLAFSLLPIGHDAVRLVTIGSVTATAMLCGLCTLGLDRRRPSLAIAAGVLVGLRIVVPFANEPGHPQIIVTILVAAIAAVLAWWNSRRPIIMAAIVGVLVAALTMTKVNVGAYAGISIFITIIFATDQKIWYARPLIPVLILASACLPLALISSRLSTDSAVLQAIFYILPLTAMLITAVSSSAKLSGPRLTTIPLLSYVLGGTIAAVALCIYALQNGATVGGLVNGVVTMPQRMASVFGTGPGISGSLFEAALSFMVAVIFYYFTHRGWHPPAPLIVLLKLAFALTVILPGLGISWASNPTGWGVSLVGWGLFLWIFLVPIPTLHDQIPPTGVTLPRLGFALLAAFQPLQSYPVAGSQAKTGTMLMIPAAIICLADLLDWAKRDALGNHRGTDLFKSIGTVAVIALIAFVSTSAFWQRSTYLDLMPLDLKQSSRLRLDERQVAGIRWLVANVQESSTTFLAPTGLNSLYLWAGVEPASRIVITDQVFMFTESQQHTLLDTLEASPRPIIIDHANFFTPPSQASAHPWSPVLEGIVRDFTPYGPGAVEGYTLRYKRGNPTPEMVEYAAWKPTNSAVRPSALVDIQPKPGQMLARISIAAINGESIGGAPAVNLPDIIIADTAAESAANHLDVFTNTGEKLDWPLSLNVRQKLTIESPVFPQSSSTTLTVARLFDESSRLITSIPFVTPFVRQP